jgi:predicted permease
MIEALWLDLRYAVRELGRSKAFSCIAIGSLAVGIGAATATFAAVDALMLRPLPVQSPDRLVAFSTASGRGWAYWSNAAFVRWRNDPGRLYDVAAGSDVMPLKTAGDHSQSSGDVRVALVSDNYFQVLGAGIVFGRAFASAEANVPGQSNVAVISDNFWQLRFDRSPDVLTKTIELQGVEYAVIGVAPRRFTGHVVGYPADVWLPLAMQPVVKPGFAGLEQGAGPEVKWLQVIGRMNDDTTPERVAVTARLARQSFLAEKAARVGADTPEGRRDRAERVAILPAAKGNSPARARFERPLLILAGITALVLLVACTNFTNLMIARTEARRKEFAIRLALGGRPWRLVQQAATECVATAIGAGGLGLLVTVWAIALTMPLVAALEPIDFGLDLNGRVLAFAGVCVSLAVAFGLWPCMRPVRAAGITSVQHAANWRGDGRTRSTARRLLLVAQLAACTVLLIGAGLLLRTVVNLRSQDLGYDPQVLLIPIAAERPGASREATAALVQQLREELLTVPGVQAVGISGAVLLDNRAYWVDGSQQLTTDRGVALAGSQWTFAPVGDGLFDALDMRLVRGHGLSDRGQSKDEVVLNQSLATFLFGEDDPIGRRLALGPKAPMQTIVGVVKDARQVSPRDRGLGVVYGPLRQVGYVTMAVRADTASRETTAAIRQQASAILANVQEGRMATIAEELDRAIARERLMSGISLVLSLLAVGIACVGLYALIAYSVTRRHHELGIRLALGATGQQLVRMLLGEGAAIVVAGLAIGIPLGIAASRLLSSQLYDVTAGDPWTVLTVGALLTSVAMAAALRPALGAARVDPSELLRHE